MALCPVDAACGLLCGLCELLHHCVNGYPHLDLDARIAVAGSWQTWAFSTKSWQTFIHAANHDPGQSRDRNRGSSPFSPPGGPFKPDERARQRWIPADPKRRASSGWMVSCSAGLRD